MPPGNLLEYRERGSWLKSALTALMVVMGGYALLSIILLLEASGLDEYTQLLEGGNLPIAPELQGIRLYLSVGFGLTMLACVVLYCRWLYRLCENAHRVTGREFPPGPGWNVGYYFVPFLNLIRPFYRMNELYALFAERKIPQDRPSEPLISRWWFGWIIGSILGNFASMLDSKVSTVPGWRIATEIDLVATALTIFSAIMLIRLIDRLESYQENYEQLETVPPAAESQTGQPSLN